MVIDFPTVARGGAPATEERTPEDDAAFAALVDGLLAEEPARSDDGEAGVDRDGETPPTDVAAYLLALTPPVGNVPAPTGLSGSDPNDPAVAPSQQGASARAADMTPATGAPATWSGPSAGSQPGGPGPVAGAAWAGVGPASSEAASAFGTTAAASGPQGAELVAASAPGVTGTGPLLPVSSGSLTDPFGGAGEPQGSTPPPPASATGPSADTTLAEPGEAPEGDLAARKHPRGHVEQPWSSPSDQGQSHADAVQRVASFVDLGPDLGSSARDGSHESGTPASFQAGVHVTPAGATPASTAGALLSAAGGHASPADDVVLPQLVRAMRLQVTGGVGEARIQLDPAHLGAVTVSLRVEGGVVSAVVTAEQAGVRHWIESHEASLRQALAEQGLLLDRLHVERDGRPPGEHPSQGQDDTPRRRAPRKDTATFELLA